MRKSNPGKVPGAPKVTAGAARDFRFGETDLVVEFAKGRAVPRCGRAKCFRYAGPILRP